MNKQTSATVVILGTLLTGVALGALGVGAWSETRNRARAELAGPGGFVNRVEHLLEPRPDQREVVRAALEATDARNREIAETARADLREELTRLRAQLETVLDAEQLTRLDGMLRRPPPPPPGMGRPGEGRPPGPRGEGPPRGRRGPPPSE